MAKKTIYSEDTLREMGLVKFSDGSYGRPKSKPQPREIKNHLHKPDGNYPKYEKDKIEDLASNETRKLSLILMGEPMAKQSVRATKSGHYYQPEKYKQREKDYKKQIVRQLPVDFQMFTQEVRITKLHFLYAPLKSFHKIKGRMDAIRNGELIQKTTRPDMSDNLKKLLMDCLSGIVIKDDGIVWGEDNVRKYYSTGGCVIIELEGK